MENSPKSLLEQTKTARQARRAWYLYDFGNSAYAAIILLAVFSACFKNVVVGGAEGTRMWGIAVGIAAILVALISPILGAIADSSRSKKLFLFVFTGISVIFTALLFFVGKGDTIMAMVFFIMAETTFYDEPTLEVMKRIYGQLPELRDQDYYRANPLAPPFDIRKAQRLLGYKPRFHWCDIERWEDQGGGNGN